MRPFLCESDYLTLWIFFVCVCVELGLVLLISSFVVVMCDDFFVWCSWSALCVGVSTSYWVGSVSGRSALCCGCLIQEAVEPLDWHQKCEHPVCSSLAPEFQTFSQNKTKQTILHQNMLYQRVSCRHQSICSHLCWTTSRSSSLVGISMLCSHCSFSPTQSWQALASLNMRYNASAPSKACRHDDDSPSNSS